MDKVNFLTFQKDDLLSYLELMGEKQYRAKQLWKWVYTKGIKSFDEMTDISDSLKKKLKLKINIPRLDIHTHQKSIDGTQKWLFNLEDNKKIETVYIPEEDRGTLCISSQVGCTLSCSFCHTGTMPLVRNLKVNEIIAQVLTVKDSLLDWSNKKDNRKITNIVFMGMGEPLYNYNAVLKASRVLLDNEGLCYSRRKITLSTSGVVPFINKLKKELEVSLAISLHAVRDEIRND